MGAIIGGSGTQAQSLSRTEALAIHSQGWSVRQGESGFRDDSGITSTGSILPVGGNQRAAFIMWRCRLKTE